MRRSRFSLLIMMLCLLPFMQGWSGSCLSSVGQGAADRIGDSLDRINQTMGDAVQTLGTQSSQWQGTLKDLQAKLTQDTKDIEKQVVSDVNQIIDHIDDVVKDGIQFAQESFNCQTDIFASHARISVQNLLNQLLNKFGYKGISNRPILPFEPIVCSANPTAIDLATWSSAQGQQGQLVLSGVDFNIFGTDKPDVVIKIPSTERVVPALYVARETNYRLAVNVLDMKNNNVFFTTSPQQMEIRWQGRKVNSNEINITPFTAPPPPDPCGSRGLKCCGGTSCTSSVCVSGMCRGYTVSSSISFSSFQWGGGGGSPFADQCSPGDLGVGLSGRSGTEVDGTQLLCSHLNPDGTRGGTASATTYRGGGGGGPYSAQCPNGQLLIGLNGRSGDLTDQLIGICASLPRILGTGGDESNIGPWGGSGGGPFTNLSAGIRCPSHQVVIGIAGRSGTLLDGIRFNCGTVTLQ